MKFDGISEGIPFELLCQFVLSRFFPPQRENVQSVLLVNAAAFAVFAAVDADAAGGADLGGDVSADLVKRGWCCWRCCQCESL